MHDLVVTLAVGTLMFVSTNIDDLVILVAFFADPAFRARQIVVGQFLGMAALIAMSAAGALLALAVPEAYVGLLGLVPLGLGIGKLVQRLRGRADDDDDEAPARAGGAGRVLMVAAVTVANGGDNLAVYIPAFAVQTAGQLVVLVVVFLVLTGAFCLLSHYLVNHPRLGAILRRHAERALPFVLMAIGIYILWEMRVDRLLSG